LSVPPRPEVENLKICAHGGLDWAELQSMGLNPEDVLDFSVCTNPFPPPPAVKKALSRATIGRYPDSESTEFRQCLSEKLGVAVENILAGSGSTELIRLIALAYFRRGDSALILAPAYGEYEVACQMMGVQVIKQWGRPEHGFKMKIEETVVLIRQSLPKVIFICHPNNPTGQYLSREEIESILIAGANRLLVLDEAYIAFTDGVWSPLDLLNRGNLIIVRSMTKDYTLAGLRLGYAVASLEIIDNLRKVRPPWNVNAVAQKAGIAALKDGGYLERCKSKIKQAKQFLVDELGQFGFNAVPSSTNFFLVRVGDAKAFRSVLLKKGILVRDCTSFGLPEYVRIAPRTMPECQKLITAVHELRDSGKADTNFERG